MSCMTLLEQVIQCVFAYSLHCSMCHSRWVCQSQGRGAQAYWGEGEACVVQRDDITLMCDGQVAVKIMDKAMLGVSVVWVVMCG